MASQHVIDVTEQNFRSDLIEYSMQAPVIVDFWAEWCGPCRTLGPILERLAEEYGGLFRLAKVDTDREQRLAASFQIQSMPTVVAVFQGQLVDQFVGGLPAHEVKRFVDGVLERCGLEPPVGAAPTDPAQAERHWRKRLQKSPDDSEAILALSRLLVARGAIDEARTGFAKIDVSAPEYSAAQAALAALNLIGPVAEAGGEEAIRARLEANSSDWNARYLLACADAGRGQLVSALAALVELVGAAPQDVQGDAKKAAAIVFEAAGRDNPEVEIQRRRLARLLF